MLYTLRDLVEFCYENKRHKGFKQFAWSEIAESIVWAANTNKLLVVTDEQGLCGVCVFTIFETAKRLYIHHIVAVRNGFRALVNKSVNAYAEYSITGMRRGKIITFNKKHLWAITKA